MNKKQKKILFRIIISLVCFISLFILFEFVDSTYLKFILFLGLYLYIAYDIILKALKNLRNIRFLDENFLMIIASIGAFIIGAYEEAVAVILFYQVGELFQSYAVNKSRKSISELMQLRPDYANLLIGDEIKTVDPENVKIDDVILVKPGEKIPLDGVIISGNAHLDVKSLTGESLPKEVSVDDNVLSGSININGSLKIKVTKIFEDSTVAKILDLVENATTKKAKTENFITKFARFYTPIVVVLAILLAIIGGVITTNYLEWIYRACNFLVVSCPCALVISIPLSFFAGIATASKNGILIKGGSYLEKFDDIDTFIFDKTGTLTKGSFKVDHVYPTSNCDEILKLAAIAEHKSNHPIAKSIVSAYGKDIDLDYEITEKIGYGIVAKKDDVIYCGNKKLMDKYNIVCPNENNIGTLIYVALNNEFKGIIHVVDELKEESYNVIKELNKAKIKTIMLTGDNEETAKIVAEDLNLNGYKANLLPQDKVEVLEQYLATGKVCFIGDGINDSPVLMRADIGISMGVIGSDAAIEACDIVLMNDDLSNLLVAKKISKKTMRIVIQNIVFAIGIKVLVMILSALGLSNMWFAVFADVGVAIIAILNAFRAFRN